MSEDLYKTIKKLSEINAITKTEIARITGTSVTTVGRVRQTANYMEKLSKLLTRQYAEYRHRMEYIRRALKWR